MDDEHPQEGHLLACVLEDDAWIIRLAPKAVRSHHHGQVVDVHLGDGHVGGLSENLGATRERATDRERGIEDSQRGRDREREEEREQ